MQPEYDFLSWSFVHDGVKENGIDINNWRDLQVGQLGQVVLEFLEDLEAQVALGALGSLPALVLPEVY